MIILTQIDSSVVFLTGFKQTRDVYLQHALLCEILHKNTVNLLKIYKKITFLLKNIISV